MCLSCFNGCWLSAHWARTQAKKKKKASTVNYNQSYDIFSCFIHFNALKYDTIQAHVNYFQNENMQKSSCENERDGSRLCVLIMLPQVLPCTLAQRSPLAEIWLHVNMNEGVALRGGWTIWWRCRKTPEHLYGDVWLLSPATDMTKWLHLNKRVWQWDCVLPPSVSHQMRMNNTFTTLPPPHIHTLPVLVHTISLWALCLACPAGRATGDTHTLCHRPMRGVGVCSLFTINQQGKLFNNNKEAVKTPPRFMPEVVIITQTWSCQSSSCICLLWLCRVSHDSPSNWQTVIGGVDY